MKRLNSNHLKLLAIIAMTVDHATDLFYPSFPALPMPFILHVIGRLTAPIMWFFVAEGYHYTHNLKNYMSRLGIFALVSHFAYCFAFGMSYVPFKTGIFNQTSVMYPLFIAVVVLWLQDNDAMNKTIKHIFIFVLIWSAFPADWSCIAVLSIIGIYRNRGNLKKQTAAMMAWVLLYAVVSFLFVSKIHGILELFVIIVYPVMKCYNGERGKVRWLKWFFYIYYPAHLIIIGIIRMLMYGDVCILQF
ncbi:TraX family protein [Butyrivibrio sp. M55]|uniref:TraX family protein n=1 Tax=Butyrivibrio sp. M55 TaxID=1855323 RepID=UPI0008EC2D03|nr:TraX family protein [Butyrivibrio sp. M55]SFU45414.1 TraX protein [Butyrivibrio sp. M55]